MAAARVAIVGGGPAGLMAAERLAGRGFAVEIFEGMPTVGRKFLLAGKSGLNITHAEPYERFRTRFGAANADLAAALDAFPPEALIAWANGLGVETFAGSSGRVFPKAMKASPLLRAWLRRLAEAGVTIRTRHRWTGFAEDGALRFETPGGPLTARADAVVLALGGASWPRLGSDGGWVPILEAEGVAVAPLRPANCGFDVDWSAPFADRNAGAPVKSVTMTVDGRIAPGEFVVTRTGIEGSLVYAHAAALRDALEAGRPARLTLDLVPNRLPERLARDLARPRGKQSFSTFLRKATGLEGVKAALVRETLDEATRADPARLAAALKAIRLTVIRPRPIAEAISSAGGVRFDALGPHFEVKALPGIHVAGEMLDWEAPTGGYLLTACMATGRWAADGIAERLGTAG
ncbi:TIGR03862 family flavoprotein [Chthonobacter albigriseus]|uniref:TIGR03862 family flavoprotein n=1 Tax=Chthonobacter albigriseus TaxID=1683161 RepID=UPI0015EEB987|nr:TIGR03862 family flavoprotein [Chthonobacter albigriseus]